MTEEELIWCIERNVWELAQGVEELRVAMEMSSNTSPLKIPKPTPPKSVKGVFAKSPDPIVFGPDVLYRRLDMMVDYLYWENEDGFYIASYDPSEWEHLHPYG